MCAVIFHMMVSLLLRFRLPGTKNPVTVEEADEVGRARLEGTDICDSGDGE